MIKLDNVVKIFGQKIAVDNSNLQINDGEIFGLIGHNGAGKTTTLNMLLQISEPTSGQIYINDLLVNQTNELAIKKMIGFVPDAPDVFLKMRLYDYLNFVADAYEIDNQTRKTRIEQLLAYFDITSEINTPLLEFSHGMRQKAVLIASYMATPKYWILDEPLTGLDPEAGFKLKKLMKEHAKNGGVVLFSTHVLDVAEKLCDRIAIMRHGQIIFIGTLSELQTQYTGTLEEIYLQIFSGVNTNE